MVLQHSGLKQGSKTMAAPKLFLTAFYMVTARGIQILTAIPLETWAQYFGYVQMFILKSITILFLRTLAK